MLRFSRYVVAGLLALFLAGDTSVSYAADANKSYADPHFKWFLPETPDPRATVICINGLNTRPEIMDPLIEVLVNNNLAVLRVGLRGHLEGESFEEFATQENWLKQLLSAQTLVRGKYPEKHVYAVGYSLGSLLLVRYADLNPSQSFDKMFLIAPAVSLSWQSAVVRGLTPLRFLGISLPSLAPEEVRAHNWTPLSVYKELTELVDKVSDLKNPTDLSDIQTIVALNKNDALVSASGVRTWIESNKLLHWGILDINPAGDADNLRGHLLVNESGLGIEPWNALTRKLLEHFR